MTEDQITYHCDRAEMILEIIQRFDKISRVGHYYIGKPIDGQKFQFDIQGDSMSEPISGTIMKIWETQNTGYAAIRSADDKYHIVCLG